MTLEVRIKETKDEMQVEIDKLRIEIQLLLERLARKDSEIRKLIIQLEEWKEWRIKYEELYKKYTLDIQILRKEYETKISALQVQIKELRKEYETKISVLQVELKDLRKEYERLKKEHSLCGLQKAVRPKSPDSSYKDEVSEEEKLEVVQVLAVKTEDQQFEVVEERRLM